MPTKAEIERAAKIARYDAAYLAANGSPARCRYDRNRYRVGMISVFTGPQLERATERLEALAKEPKPVERPLGKISTPAKAQQAREYLGVSRTEMARIMRLGSDNGRKTVQFIEEGQNTRGVPGPYQVALEALVSGWRPWGVKIEGKD